MMMNFLRRWIVAFQVVLVSSMLLLDRTQVVTAQDIANHPHLTTGQTALHRKLLVASTPLSPGEIAHRLQLISSVYDLPIWLDREVPKDFWVIDPRRPEGQGSEGQLAENQALSNEINLIDLLRQLAEQADATVVCADGIVAIVPEGKFDLMEYSVWSYKVDNAFQSWSRIEPLFGWETGASMRSVALDWSDHVGLDNRWLEALPHDLWGPFQFSKLNRRAAASCLLTSMNRIAVQVAGRIEIMDWQMALQMDPVSDVEGEARSDFNQVVWTYAAKDIRRLGADHCRDWKGRHPEAAIARTSHGDWRIRARPRAHRDLVQPLLPVAPLASSGPSSTTTGSTTTGSTKTGPSKAKSPVGKETLYSGQMRGTLQLALASIGKSLELDFDLPNLPSELLNREISIEYLRVDLQELLEMLADDAGVVIEAAGQGRYIVRDRK